ncbi:MAG: hypothetical protein RIM68_09750 [Arenibacter sp.]|jgi:hypothetical protein|uniref:hypothetical protein n=1 Tax=Alloalcanivorax xenomutans TaxID=1094342 RepID=UPI000E367F16
MDTNFHFDYLDVKKGLDLFINEYEFHINKCFFEHKRPEGFLERRIIYSCFEQLWLYHTNESYDLTDQNFRFFEGALPFKFPYDPPELLLANANSLFDFYIFLIPYREDFFDGHSVENFVAFGNFINSVVSSIKYEFGFNFGLAHFGSRNHSKVLDNITFSKTELLALSNLTASDFDKNASIKSHAVESGSISPIVAGLTKHGTLERSLKSDINQLYSGLTARGLKSYYPLEDVIPWISQRRNLLLKKFSFFESGNNLIPPYWDHKWLRDKLPMNSLGSLLSKVPFIPLNFPDRLRRGLYRLSLFQAYWIDQVIAARHHQNRSPGSLPPFSFLLR